MFRSSIVFVLKTSINCCKLFLISNKADFFVLSRSPSNPLVYERVFGVRIFWTKKCHDCVATGLEKDLAKLIRNENASDDKSNQNSDLDLDLVDD